MVAQHQMTRAIERFNFFDFSFRPGPSLHNTAVPHLLRLLLIYQENAVPASPSGHYFEPPIFWPFALPDC